MKNISSHFIIATMAVLIFWLLADKCKRPVKPAIPSAPAIVKEVAKVDSAVHRLADSLKRENTLLRKQAAAERAKYVEKDRQLSRAATIAQRLAKNIDSASTDEAYRSSCDSLKQVVQDNAGILEETRRSHERERDYLMQIDSNHAVINSAKDSLIAVQKKAIINITKENVAFASRINTLQKKNSKKFSFGIGIAYGVGPDGKITAVTGVTLHYQIFKF